jgi:hypothetical protein
MPFGVGTSINPNIGVYLGYWNMNGVMVGTKILIDSEDDP